MPGRPFMVKDSKAQQKVLQVLSAQLHWGFCSEDRICA